MIHNESGSRFRVGDGRSTIWIDRSIPLYFTFYGSKIPTINSVWLEMLNDSANSAPGLVLMPEPEVE